MTYAAVILEGTEAPGAYRATLVPLAESANAVTEIGRRASREEKVAAVSIYTARRRAAEVVAAWNADFERSGSALYVDTPLF